MIDEPVGPPSTGENHPDVPPPKKIKYLMDRPLLYEEARKEPIKIYVRAWKEGKGRDADICVQVWVGKSIPEGDPTGDWAMPVVLGLNDAVKQAIAQTL